MGATSAETARVDGPTADVLRPDGVFKVLRDGTSVQIRLLGPADGDRLRAFHERLSLESTIFRYFTPKPHLSDRDIAWLTDVDVVNRCAFVAVEQDRIIAVGRWMREAATDDGPSPRAEVAFVTSDEEQGRGIGSLLLSMLIEMAGEFGITTFTASVMIENMSMTHIFRTAGYSVVSRVESGVRELEIDLTTPA